MTNHPDNQGPNKGKDDEQLGSFYMGRMRPPPEPERTMPRGLVTILTLLAFAVIIWYAYPQGQEKHETADVPVIAADTNAYKFKPENPGGMEVRHQDSTVFNPIVKKSADEVERLLPQPEEPLNKEDALKDKVALDKDKPEMKLDLKMEEVAEGTEKVVTAEEAQKMEAAKAAEAKATGKAAEAPKESEAAAKKEEPKATAKGEPKAEAKAETKAEMKEQAAKTEPAKAAATGGVAMQLGSYKDEAAARQDWSRLQKKFSSELGGLTTRIERVDLGAKGVWHRLYATAPTQERAETICAAVRAGNPGGCIVVKK